MRFSVSNNCDGRKIFFFTFTYFSSTRIIRFVLLHRLFYFPFYFTEWINLQHTLQQIPINFTALNFSEKENHTKLNLNSVFLSYLTLYLEPHPAMAPILKGVILTLLSSTQLPSQPQTFNSNSVDSVRSTSDRIDATVASISIR